MTRTLVATTPADVEVRLRELVAGTSTERYREAMHALGEQLGVKLSAQMGSVRTVLVVCTVEDADWLARGLIQSLSAVPTTYLACFWNDRHKTGQMHKISVAPVIRRYVEPIASPQIDAVVIAKSIISNGCVVRTNLIETLQVADPKDIYIAAPVISDTAKSSLAAEFPATISSKFKYCYFAVDSRDSNSGEISPGIGGDVYQRLGFSGQDGKNTYRPSLVQERYRKLRHA